MTTPTFGIPGYIAGTWDVDPVHSHIGFVARHMMVSKVRGRFDRFEAQIVPAEDPFQSSAAATVDMNSEQVQDADNGAAAVLVAVLVFGFLPRCLLGPVAW